MLISTAHAQAASGPAAGGTAGLLAQFGSFVPLVFIFVIFYFLLIRPQQRRLKEHRAMIGAVKRGDQVVTGGGLMGKVIKVDGDIVEVELAPNMRVRAMKATLAEVKVTGAPVAANDAKG